ncbi:MAG: ABC transporter ATP-binding protein [Lachnospiraceae bacterium]|nr:ABC transporter ATP-binding protein [Lachnospiraceae bacterium]
MKILKNLVKLHNFLFRITMILALLSIILNLCWNKFLAGLLDILGGITTVDFESGSHVVFAVLPTGIFIILLHTISEYLSSYLASYTCEIFAHEMRMAYVRYYLRGDIRMLSRMNVGEEQSAMQNELKDISDYLNENLFSLVKQFGTFAVTVVFLLSQNVKLAFISILPVIPLIVYCACSSKIIKNYTAQCQSSKQKTNGLADMILDLFPIIQVYDAYKLIKDTMAENLSEWENANVKKERITAGLMSLSGVLSFVPLLLLLGAGGAMVITGEISIGTFYIFINLSGNVSGFLQNMPGIYANFRGFSASVDRLEEKLIFARFS